MLKTFAWNLIVTLSVKWAGENKLRPPAWSSHHVIYLLSRLFRKGQLASTFTRSRLFNSLIYYLRIGGGERRYSKINSIPTKSFAFCQFWCYWQEKMNKGKEGRETKISFFQCGLNPEDKRKWPWRQQQLYATIVSKRYSVWSALNTRLESITCKKKPCSSQVRLISCNSSQRNRRWLEFLLVLIILRLLCTRSASRLCICSISLKQMALTSSTLLNLICLHGEQCCPFFGECYSLYVATPLGAS